MWFPVLKNRVQPPRGGRRIARPGAALFLSAAVLAAAAGCRHDPATPGRSAGNVDVPPPREGERPVEPPADRTKPPPVDPAQVKTDKFQDADRCAGRLHDIGGLILMYYALHRQMPPTLNSIRELADPGDDINFACPGTGREYVYDLNGLVPAVPGADSTRRLVLYDPTPAHGGSRRGLVVQAPRGGQQPQVFAVEIPEQVFKTYTPPTVRSPFLPGRPLPETGILPLPPEAVRPERPLPGTPRPPDEPATPQPEPNEQPDR